MKVRDFKVGEDARQSLHEALHNIAEAVGSTMGPGGRPFGFDKLGIDMRLTSTFSKDGLTVLRSLNFEEPHWQAVLEYCKQAASHSVIASGDGTTSTVILADAVAQAVRNSDAKYPQYYARLLEHDAKMAIEGIRAEAIKDESATRKVAFTASNGDEELTDVVIDSITQSSAFGTILVEKNPLSSQRYSIDRQDGYSNCGGYQYNTTFAISADSNAASSQPMEWEDAYVLTFNGQLLEKRQIEPILEKWNEICKRDGWRNLVIVAYEVGDAVANTLLVKNRQISGAQVVNNSGRSPAAFVVKPKITAEVNSGLHILRDIASFCGISDEHIVDGGNYNALSTDFFGTCKKVKMTTSSTMFLGRAPNHWVDQRILQNKSIAEFGLSEFDKEITKIRNAELAEGLVKVQVGGGLLPDLQERADRFDDASKAAKACMRSGALPGAGCSYIRAALLGGVDPALEEALRSVNNRILVNYGVSPDTAFVPARGQSILISNLEAKMGNALDIGVVDACETVCAVIQNGVSLGVKIATLGGYSFRTKSEREYEQ